MSSLLFFFVIIIILVYFVFVSYGTGGGILDQWTVRSFKCPLHTIYRRKIKSTGTLRHVLRILQTTINDSLSKAGKTYSEQTPLNRSQQLSASYRRQTTYWRTQAKLTTREWQWTNDNLTTINDCLIVAIDGLKRTDDITSLRSQ